MCIGRGYPFSTPGGVPKKAQEISMPLYVWIIGLTALAAFV
jgi:hypothetical protein